MLYARIQNNVIAEYPLFEGDIKLRFPNVSFSDSFTPPDEYTLIEDVPYPQVSYTQNVSEGIPQLIDSKWTRVWVITEASAEEIDIRTELKASDVLKVRNNILKASDWTQLQDSPLSEPVKLAWAVYRQELREIVNQPSYPWEVTWPLEPPK